MAAISITEGWLAKTAADEESGKAAALPTAVDRERYWDDALPGFGVVVGRRFATFVVQHRVAGRQRRVAIGRYGKPGAGEIHADRWTVARARKEAMRLLGAMSSGIDPSAEARKREGGPTLRAGLELHASNMRKAGRAERSIETIEGEVPRLLAAWLDRPIAEIRGVDLVALHDRLTDQDKPSLANRIVAHVSTIWNALDRVHELDGRNPARAVTRNRYVPNRERIPDAEMPAWLEKVQQLSPVRRDLQMFCLFTGMRSDAARHVRWEHLDEKRRALIVPRPKGGEAKAFTLPLADSTFEMLLARRRANAMEMKPFHGDHGWAFPSLSREAPFTVQPIAEPKEYRRIADEDDEKVTKKRVMPGLHVLRRTYLSVATEAGIGELDRHVLANHAFGRQSVNATYIEQALPHLAECQARIERALWQRLKPRSKTSRRKQAA